MRNFLLLSSLLMVSASAVANEAIKYTCTLNNAERIIEVVYNSTDKPTPCSVSYTKDGDTQTLWHYENTQGQCEIKAEEFVAKQNGWGWSCNNTPATASSAQ